MKTGLSQPLANSSVSDPHLLEPKPDELAWKEHAWAKQQEGLASVTTVGVIPHVHVQALSTAEKSSTLASLFENQPVLANG